MVVYKINVLVKAKCTPMFLVCIALFKLMQGIQPILLTKYLLVL